MASRLACLEYASWTAPGPKVSERYAHLAPAAFRPRIRYAAGSVSAISRTGLLKPASAARLLRRRNPACQAVRLHRGVRAGLPGTLAPGKEARRTQPAFGREEINSRFFAAIFSMD